MRSFLDTVPEYFNTCIHTYIHYVSNSFYSQEHRLTAVILNNIWVIPHHVYILPPGIRTWQSLWVPPQDDIVRLKLQEHLCLLTRLDLLVYLLLRRVHSSFCTLYRVIALAVIWFVLCRMPNSLLMMIVVTYY